MFDSSNLPALDLEMGLADCDKSDGITSVGGVIIGIVTGVIAGLSADAVAE